MGKRGEFGCLLCSSCYEPSFEVDSNDFGPDRLGRILEETSIAVGILLNTQVYLFPSTYAYTCILRCRC